MKKTIIVSAVMMGVVTLGGSAAVVNAQTPTTSSTKSTTGKSKHHKQYLGVRLAQAERDGTVNSAQAAAFKAEMKKLHDEHKQAVTSSSTKAQHQAERAKLKTELQAWAKANDFPLDKLLPKSAS